jgi:hypothetical protein
MSKPFPKYLSAPYQILWFESDDLAIIMQFFAMAILFGGFFWLLIVIGPYFYAKFKSKYPRGFFKHCFLFLGIIHLKGYPIFFETHFQE